jgi:hypothetical protein
MVPALAALIPAIAGAAGQIGSSAVGGALAAGDKARAAKILEQILGEYGQIDVPELEKLTAEELGPSAMERVREEMDPRLREQQMRVLSQLGEFSTDGDSVETQAAMNNVMGDIARQESAGRNAILNNMRARGVAGSGAELAAQLSNNQAAADRAQSAGLQIGADAKRRMYDAMLAQGQMAGNVRNQEYGELSDAAKSRDLISRYNAGERSRTRDYNAQLAQRNFDNRLQLTQAKSNAAGGVASNLQRSAADTQALAGGVGRGLGQLGATVGGWYADQDDEKKGTP